MRRPIAFLCAALILRRGRVAAFLACFAALGARRPAPPPSVVKRALGPERHALALSLLPVNLRHQQLVPVVRAVDVPRSQLRRQTVAVIGEQKQLTQRRGCVGALRRRGHPREGGGGLPAVRGLGPRRSCGGCSPARAAGGDAAGVGVGAVTVGSMRCSRSEVYSLRLDPTITLIMTVCPIAPTRRRRSSSLFRYVCPHRTCHAACGPWAMADQPSL